MRKTPKPLPVIHLRSGDQKLKRQWDAALEDALTALGEIDFLYVSPPDDRDHGGLCSLSDLWQQRYRGAAAYWHQVNDYVYDLIADSISIDGVHFDSDFEKLRSFRAGGRKCTAALYAHLNSFYDEGGVEAQEKLMEFVNAKLRANADLDDFTVHCNSKYGAWKRVTGNSPLQPFPFFKVLLYSMPTEPFNSPLVLTRNHLAHLVATEDVLALCKKALGVFIWLIQSYPALATPTSICCGTMHSPSYEMLACLRHTAMYMITHDEPLTFGGAHVGSIFPPMDQSKLLEPFNVTQKAGYYHYFSDASNRDPSISGGAGMIKGGVMQTACLRQHLTAPCSHTSEVVSAGTNLHLIVPVNGTLQELGIRLGIPTPFYVDSKSTSFVCKAETAVKKSAWILRRVKVLHEGVQYEEILPIHIPECDMVADGFTKYIPAAVWRRHMHYLLNKGLDYPPGKQQAKGGGKIKGDTSKDDENA